MNKLDKEQTLGVAVSGGVDSIALCEYLRRKKFNVSVVFFNHNDDYAQTEADFVFDYTSKNGLTIISGETSRRKLSSESNEEYWRNMRYEFFKSLNIPIATGHTLDDLVTWYLFTCCHGEGRLIPYQHGNVIRPFLLTEKSKIIKYCQKNNINWLEDPSNQDITFATKNRITKNVLPEILKINPGFYKVIKKKALLLLRK